MYERFTDRARRVMQLANQEAQRFNHEYVGTEHPSFPRPLFTPAQLAASRLEWIRPGSDGWPTSRAKS